MTLPAPDYLAGMTKSEAINFINHLPGLNRDEFAALMDAAEKRPEKRYGTYLPDYKKNPTVENRIVILIEYIRKNRRVTHAQITSDLKWNGANTYYVIKEAIARKLIIREPINKQSYVYMLPKKKGRTS